MYIVRKYKMYLYELQKKGEKGEPYIQKNVHVWEHNKYQEMKSMDFYA